MKQIILILLFLTASIFANDIDERKTDLYFGNGVWNSYAMAENGRDKLQERVDANIIKGNQQLKEKYSKVKLVYNWTGTSPDNNPTLPNKIYDVIETFYQLRKEGQLDGLGTIYDFIESVMSKRVADSITLIDSILNSYVSSIESDNLLEMNERYDNESFNKSHRVLLIAHSQGNLFGNSVYDALGWKKDYFKMVSIATPAKRVTNGTSPYTTFKCDQIINNWLRTESLPVGIPGHLPGNTECTENELKGNAHELVEYYLPNVNSLMDIMTNVENQLLSLDSAPTQWKKSSEFACGCDKRINVVHEYDSSLDTLMKDVEIVKFDEFGKLYPIDSDYYKGSAEGDSIKKYDVGDVCMDLLDYENNKIDEFLGRAVQQETKDGVVEISLTWNRPELDYEARLNKLYI